MGTHRGRRAVAAATLATALSAALLLGTGPAATAGGVPNRLGGGAKPGAPTITGVTAGNASATVTFVAPSFSGGSPITSYTARCTSGPGAATGTTSGPASPLLVTGLTNGATYTCAVTATNAGGTGPASAPSGPFVPATIPGAPTITAVTAANTAGLVAFHAPASNGGSTITGYTATCTSTNSGATGTLAGSTSPLLVTGLTNGKTYTCTVTATNAVGTGAASAPSGPFVPAAVPDAPTVTSVTPGVNSVAVAFSPPASSGGDVITSYTATCTSSDGGATGTMSGPASPLTVTGLTTDHFYTCTVAATNVMGTGPASAPSDVFGPPGAPAITQLVPAPTQATVDFSAPASTNGSAITSYSATCTSTNGGTTGAASGAANPVVVPGLTAGSTYTCTVTATNVSGAGPASNPSEAFVAQNPDYLFALGSGGLAVCPDPTALLGAQQGCLSGFAPIGTIGDSVPVTDGVNVYWATMYMTGEGPGWSCPIATGTSCTTVFTGPTNSSVWVTSLAVANGEFFFGQSDGSIWRCPANVPWANGDPVPGGCVELDNAGTKRQADHLVVANGRLYAALNEYTSGTATSIIWSCDLQTVNACTELDNSGWNQLDVLTAGAGYLWAGLDNGIIWRCDLDTANACQTWDTGPGAISDLSYDGQGTLYAYVAGDPTVVWSCPTATQNACGPVVTGLAPSGPDDYNGKPGGAWGDVAAGAGSVFATGCTGNWASTLYLGSTLLWTSANNGCAGWSTRLLYLPAGGPARPGAARVAVPLPDTPSTRCRRGTVIPARVDANGPHGFAWRRTVDLCQLRREGIPRLDWGALDAGDYSVSVRTGRYSGRAAFSVTDGATSDATVTLTRS